MRKGDVSLRSQRPYKKYRNLVVDYAFGNDDDACHEAGFSAQKPGLANAALFA